MSVKSIYEIVEVNPSEIPFSKKAYSIVQHYIHYYRLKDAFDAYVNKKPYVSYEYQYFAYDYKGFYDSLNEMNQNENAEILSQMRESKNRMMNAHMMNYRFYYYDNNKKMYYVTKNLIKAFYTHSAMILEMEGQNKEHEDTYIHQLLHAYHLWEYLYSKESFLSVNDAYQLTLHAPKSPRKESMLSENGLHLTDYLIDPATLLTRETD
jgi:hypothetical protein